MTKTANKMTWMRVKDHYHFYIFLGLVIFGSAALVVNTLYGPCQLVDTPDDFEPRYWQYDRHPMHQMIIKYSGANPFGAYEHKLGKLETYWQKIIWDREEQRARHLMYERQDYKAWYYVPYTTKWVEWSHWEFEKWKTTMPPFLQQPN